MSQVDPKPLSIALAAGLGHYLRGRVEARPSAAIACLVGLTWKTVYTPLER